MLAPGKLRIDNNFINGNKLVKKISPSQHFLSYSLRAVMYNHCSSMDVHPLKERCMDPHLFFTYVNLSFLIIPNLLRTPEEFIKYH